MERERAGSRALFPKGPSFTLEDFSNKDFIVRDFVDTLADSVGPANRRSGPATQTAFDPKPMIRSFESALQGLGNLSESLQDKESELQSDVRRAEAQHQQTLDTLGRKLEQSIRQFEELDVRLNNPSNTAPERGSRGAPSSGENAALQIGEKLDELDRKRRRALDANFIIQCWLQVSETGELTALQDIQRHGGADNKVRCAVIAHQLMRISQRLDPASWSSKIGAQRNTLTNGGNATTLAHNTREILEKFCETLEQDLLKQFNNSYRKQNFEDMRECAKVLHDFNGGASVIAVFVNQHQFFIDRDQLITEEVTTDNETWDQLADPDAEPPGVEPSLQSLVDEVRIIMQEESFIIKRAFPYYETVLIKFIQRIFQQSIQQRLEMVLEKADTISTLAFLRSLHASRSYISSLIEDLKTHGLTEHPEPCSAQIAQTLDQQLEELFTPYIMANEYIDREKRSVEELYNSLLFKYNIYHSRKKKTTTGFMASLAQQGTQLMSSAKDAYLERLESADLTPTQKRMMLRVAGLRDTDKNRNEIEVSEAEGSLSVANAKRMLTWMAESVRRTLELGSRSETPKDVAILMNLLMTSMGHVYIQTTLDAALEKATSQETSKTEPDLSYIPNMRPAVTITSLMSHFMSTVLIRLAESNSTVRRGMEAQYKTGIDAIERKTNRVVKSTVDVIVNWVAKCLATQKKADFTPRDDLEAAESLQTATCTNVCAFLSRALSLVSRTVDGRNLEVLGAELALAVRRLVFDHFKRFKVNATGGLMVTKDITEYVATLKQWPISPSGGPGGGSGGSRDVEAAVELLTEIGHLFIIGPEALRERSRNLAAGGGGVASGQDFRKLDKPDFKAFIQCREDAKSVGVQSVLSSL